MPEVSEPKLLNDIVRTARTEEIYNVMWVMRDEEGIAYRKGTGVVDRDIWEIEMSSPLRHHSRLMYAHVVPKAAKLAYNVLCTFLNTLPRPLTPFPEDVSSILLSELGLRYLVSFHSILLQIQT